MAFSLPDWLDNQFLSLCLKHKLNKPNIVVTNFNASLAAAPGNNYGSLVIRVKAEYKEDEDITELCSTSIIVKTEHIDGGMKGKFVSDDYKEPIFYNEFVPRIKKYLETSFLPDSFYCTISNTVILEDLKEKGFVMADRKKQLDFDHCRLYLVTAASLHAASVALHKEDPEFMEITMGKEKIFEGTGAEFMKINLNLALECLIKILEKNEPLRKYHSVLKDVAPSLWDMLVEAHKPSKVVNTFNQGDPWTTNMMFKYDCNGKVTNIKLLDFQAPRFGSPVNDVVFFLWSSGNNDVRQNRLSELYQIYLKGFNEKLQELNCPERLNHEQFMENVYILSPMVVFALGAMLPLFFEGTPETFDDLFEIEKGNEKVKNPYEKCYSNDYCKNHLSKLLEQMEKEGIFDYFQNCKQ